MAGADRRLRSAGHGLRCPFAKLCHGIGRTLRDWPGEAEDVVGDHAGARSGPAEYGLSFMRLFSINERAKILGVMAARSSPHRCEGTGVIHRQHVVA